MIREIVTPTDKHYMLKIPEEYINKPIEVLILPAFKEEFNEQINNVNIVKESFGILKDKNINPVKWQREIRSDREF